ncbi:MAG: DNA cytosine methyltransferase [Porphyromonas somerae]|uniref:DNA cytosine methyltransferase n=1 Tax=Porphyromonas somerae TaxID=322095 RepID=UPI0026ED24D8|nr:DNA cytosine methyltransferase [Porphyromonas somerae]MDD7557689.1 DNA cytosine methyltransferase [Porphyromonas somerae]MDY3119874.1 DNA cytosine methyltransferase [Porphyromonas somerae]MDY3883757.1 DNA cytosine methyltransferase [Porphyromonas somerae]MDY5814997.1 DNA cytosine methyltransferase [Porphyromonas somerae]
MNKKIKELHLFAGIGGGIYGGHILNHSCCGAVEIDTYCKEVLLQRQQDGWMNPFPIYGDITALNGADFKGTFDILCGGFPCQAFSHAARGKNISEKNLWPEMLRFVKESEAPIVFGENVTLKAIRTASADLKSAGYKVKYCKLSCGDLGADHRRDRYWLLAIKNSDILSKVNESLENLGKVQMGCWTTPFDELDHDLHTTSRRAQLKAVGNAQSPLVAATAFRILVYRHLNQLCNSVKVQEEEINRFFTIQTTWIKNTYGEDFGFVHTPTTMANYSAPSMMKHAGCRNFVEVFDRPSPANAEYLMGMPQGASSTNNVDIKHFKQWMESIGL